MADIDVFLDIDRAEKGLNVTVSHISRDDVLRRAKNVKTQVINFIHERSAEETGELAGSIQGELFDLEPGDDMWVASVWSDSEHALAVEEGTGLHGPRSAYIFPSGQGAMIFFHRQLGRKVWAYRVEGQPGKHMFQDGIEAASP